MKILIFSDTHKNVQAMLNIIPLHNPEAVIHLGDCLRDIKEVMQVYPHLSYFYVLGNNDFGISTDYEKTIKIGDKTIFLTHGHHFGVKSGLLHLKSAAKIRKADIVMYGHTHIPQNGYDGDLYMLNPGAVTHPLKGIPTYAVGEITDKINIEIREC